MQHIAEMDAAYDPAAWRDFGVALVSASAALLGLVFVVVSIHASGCRRRGAPPPGRDHARAARDDVRGLGGARDPRDRAERRSASS
jgi:hypothetical protein